MLSGALVPPTVLGVLLVHFLLLVDAELAGAHVDQQEEAAAGRVSFGNAARKHLHDGEDLEKVVLGKVLVRVVGV
jgi:hypothetical protein